MSALRHIGGRAPAHPLSAALTIIPTLPRPMLARFVACAIERMDEQDGDPDLEDGNDREGIDEREPEGGLVG